MTKKVYRTAQGKNVDLGALLLQNEDVRAVGNMNVNARGDTLDNQNRSIDSRNKQLTRQYNRQVTTNVSDAPIATSRRQAQQGQAPRPAAKAEKVAEAPVVEETAQPVAPEVEQPIPVATALPEGGLAAAIAKSRQIKQEALKTPRQQAQEKAGVRKL